MLGQYHLRYYQWMWGTILILFLNLLPLHSPIRPFPPIRLCLLDCSGASVLLKSVEVLMMSEKLDTNQPAPRTGSFGLLQHVH